MDTENVVVQILETKETLPLKHQLGKLLFATVIAFGAKLLAEKVYDVGLQAWTDHTFQIPDVPEAL